MVSQGRKHDLRRADAISDAMLNRQAEVTIGAVTGTLRGVYPVGDTVRVELLVGGVRAIFVLRPDAEVTVWRAER